MHNICYIFGISVEKVMPQTICNISLSVCVHMPVKCTICGGEFKLSKQFMFAIQHYMLYIFNNTFTE